MTCHPADPPTPPTSRAADDPAITHDMLLKIHARAFFTGLGSGAATLAGLFVIAFMDGDSRQLVTLALFVPWGVWVYSVGRASLADRLMRVYRAHAYRRHG